MEKEIQDELEFLIVCNTVEYKSQFPEGVSTRNISNLFDWSRTPQGDEFWRNLDKDGNIYKEINLNGMED